MNTEIISESLSCSSRSWDGSRLPEYPKGEPLITIKKITIPPGARLEMHSHPVINAGYVISGTLTVIAADGNRRDFKKGDAIIEMVNKPHYGENSGADPVELIMFYAGTEDLQLSVPAG